MAEPRDEDSRSGIPLAFCGPLAVARAAGRWDGLSLLLGSSRPPLGPGSRFPSATASMPGSRRSTAGSATPFAARSKNAGIPAMQKCFFCHDYVIPLHPEIQKEKRYYETGVPVKWVKAFYVPDFVKFRHLPHIEFGNLDCSDCHGAVQTMDRLPSLGFQMSFCIDCHRERHAQLDCWLACHH